MFTCRQTEEKQKAKAESSRKEEKPRLVSYDQQIIDRVWLECAPQETAVRWATKRLSTHSCWVLAAAWSRGDQLGSAQHWTIYWWLNNESPRAPQSPGDDATVAIHTKTHQHTTCLCVSDTINKANYRKP